MLQLITAGMALGLLGSFHCVGMCGPLALSLPVQGRIPAVRFFGTLLYNSGRVVTYSVLGLVFGLAGNTFALFGLQQYLSVGLGLLMLLYLFVGNHSLSRVFSSTTGNLFFMQLRKKLGRLYKERNFSSLFFIGLLNGLLPCGLVYMAIAGALASGDLESSVIFMAAFGLGTLPLMWAIAFLGHYMAAGLRMGIRRTYPYVMALVACLLIIRGLGLGIPYISPVAVENRGTMVECRPH